MLILSHLGKENMLHQGLQCTRAREFHWTGSTLELRIQFHKMQKGELTAQHCQKWRGFTPSPRHVLLPLTWRRLWLSDPSVSQSNRVYTQWKKADCVLLGQGRDEHSSQQEGLCPNSTERERVSKIKPSPPSAAAASPCIASAAAGPPETAQQHTGNHSQ